MLLQDKLGDYQIVLASQSPRRQALIKSLDIPYRIFVRKVDEDFPHDLPYDEVPQYLACKKAEAYKKGFGDNWILITADTVVVLDGQILGKPSTKEDAKHMLRQLSGRSHEVITGVCLHSAHNERKFKSVSKVWFRELTDEEINYYVDKYEPLDKAGAYGIQEWIGSVAVEKIEGSYYNVMGLPVHALYRELLAFLDEI